MTRFLLALALLFALPATAQKVELATADKIASISGDVRVFCIDMTAYAACSTKPNCPAALRACTADDFRDYSLDTLDPNGDNAVENAEYAEESGNAALLNDLTSDAFAQVDRANTFSKAQIATKHPLSINGGAVTLDAYSHIRTTLDLTESVTLTLGLGGRDITGGVLKHTLTVEMAEGEEFAIAFEAASGLTLNLDAGETAAFLNPNEGKTTYEFVFDDDQIEIERLQ